MQTIGQKLKAAREERRLTLDKVFESTRIRVAYLRALELDDLSSMPSPVQARGYIRNYAEYLGLNIDQLLEDARSGQSDLNVIIGPTDSTDQLDVQNTEPSLDEPASPLSPMTVDSDQGTESLDSVFVNPAEFQNEDTPQLDTSESLWQTWLNRISSVISVRVNRKAEIPNLSAVEQIETTEQPSEAKEIQIETVQPEPSQSFDSQHSSQIFKEIGASLLGSRESLSLHLDEVERNTHVKAHYLDALEQGDMARLPSTVQTRGMLSNYAAFLDMDVDSILLRFADGLQARHREKNPQIIRRQPGRPILASLPPLRSFIAGDMIFGIGMAVLLVGFVIWGINRVVTLQSQREILPTAISISDVLLASPDASLFTPTAVLLPVESFSEEATPTIIIPTVNINVSVQVNLVAAERTYMKVVVDGDVAFDGRVVPGNAYFFEAEDQVEVLVGSGAAIRVAHNGSDLGLMGAFGQIVSNIYRATEVVTPTALPTAEATNTVEPTSTSSPTITPSPSVTP
jgi:cytoskeletal protein RodZ